MMTEKQTSTSPLDPAILEQLRALQQPGSPDMLQQLTEMYVQDASKSLRTLHEALHRGDAKLLYETAHTLKSSSASLGACHLASLFEQLERMGRAGVLEGAIDGLCAAEIEFPRVCSALRAETAPQSRSGPGSAPTLRAA